VAEKTGAMISVNLPETEVLSYLQKMIALPDPQSRTVACINSPKNVTLSGSETDLSTVQRQLEIEGVFARKLQTGVAYHSRQMRNVSSQYSIAIQGLEKGQSRSQSPVMISPVTGKRVSDTSTLSNSDYWVENMVQPVKFSEALSNLISLSKSTGKKKLGVPKSQLAFYDVLEIGPHSALQRPIQDVKESLKLKHDLRYHAMLSRTKNSLFSTLEVAGRLHCLGYSVNLAEINQLKGKEKPLSDLPEYPFNHSRRYWHEPRFSKESMQRDYPPHDLLGTVMNDWNPLEARWRKVFDVLQTPWIEDHKLGPKT
jgi:acyl transferase domain-containing protein